MTGRYCFWVRLFVCLLAILRETIGPRRNIAMTFGTEKLEWFGYPTVKKI